MKAPSHSLNRLCSEARQHTDPYVNLANAIVSVAADDYRTALRENNAKLKESLEEFFFSSWYKTLTSVKPDILIKLLRDEFDGNLKAVYIS
ncbi:MAG: hypothetical protein NC489_20010 [Ruminococcus flavefaciens]|nr:hypothetical protein [Ruminococcus flavefaciens]